MKIYDIALALVRVLVVVDVIRELAGLVTGAATMMVAAGTLWSSPLTHAMTGDIVARALTLSRLAGTVFVIITDLIILVAAPRIARFASTFSSPETSGTSALH